MDNNQPDLTLQAVLMLVSRYFFTKCPLASRFLWWSGG